MASTSSRILYQFSAAFACILLSLSFASSASVGLPPWLRPSETPSEGATTESPPADQGFHFKLSEDILINASKDAVLNGYTILDLGNNDELFLVQSNSGLDNFSGIFRPFSGYYFLSTLVHVAVVAQDEAALSQAEDSTNNSEKEPRVTVSICINANCGNSAVLRSSSAIPSTGDLHTFSISGILKLERGQQLTVQVQNHSNTRQLVVFKQSAFNTYLMKQG